MIILGLVILSAGLLSPFAALFVGTFAATWAIMAVVTGHAKTGEEVVWAAVEGALIADTIVAVTFAAVRGVAWISKALAERAAAAPRFWSRLAQLRYDCVGGNVPDLAPGASRAASRSLKDLRAWIDPEGKWISIGSKTHDVWAAEVMHSSEMDLVRQGWVRAGEMGANRMYLAGTRQALINDLMTVHEVIGRTTSCGSLWLRMSSVLSHALRYSRNHCASVR